MVKIPNVVPVFLSTEAGISTTLSTQIIIQAETNNGFIPVGAIKGFNVTQTRSFAQQEIENDDSSFETVLVPGPIENVINIQRVVFDGISLTEAFGWSYRSIAVQSEPFNIQTIHTDEFGTTTTTYHNCWFAQMQTPIKADDYIIIEAATVLCERISAQRN